MNDDPLARFLAPTDAGAVRLSLGAMNFGKRTPEPESMAIMNRAFELGIRHIDTANVYTDGQSERIVGRFVKDPTIRSATVLATKCGFGRVQGQPEGLAPERVLAACDASLARLDQPSIDLYYLHVPDARTPIDETLGALAELLAQKKIRAWGVSNYAAWQVLEMIQLADARKMPRPVVAQQLYNVLVRQLDVEWFSFARARGVHTTVYNPLAGGLLSGKHARDGSTQKGSRFDKNRLYQSRYFTSAMFDRTEALTALASATGMTLLELAYAFVASAPGVDSILLGPASVAQLTSSVEATRRALTEETRAEVDAMHRAWLGTDTYYVR